MQWGAAVQRPIERVKKVFLTRSQTKTALLGFRLNGLAVCCAHNLCAAGTQIPLRRFALHKFDLAKSAARSLRSWSLT